MLILAEVGFAVKSLEKVLHARAMSGRTRLCTAANSLERSTIDGFFHNNFVTFTFFCLHSPQFCASRACVQSFNSRAKNYLNVQLF